ncbi:Uncharacterised protein [uncultured archaeon]|nr:Uncharacterised protein [uncultured archaeon]
MKNIFKSIRAILAGFVFVVILSLGTDYIMEATGVLPHGNLFVSTLLILTVIFYRGVYTVIGSYITARLAPNHPMRHVLTGGVIGLFLSIGGAIASANMNLGPAWYAWALVVLALPCAWVGGKLFELRSGGRS